MGHGILHIKNTGDLKYEKNIEYNEIIFFIGIRTKNSY